MVIIDSPGFGESDIMDEIVTQYLPQAFAFIYVINSANAGGVQKDRVSSSAVNTCNSIKLSFIPVEENVIYKQVNAFMNGFNFENTELMKTMVFVVLIPNTQVSIPKYQ